MSYPRGRMQAMKNQIMIVQGNETRENSCEVVDSPETTLTQCEEIIQRGLGTYFGVGNALLRIRDQRLYRSQYRTFQEYGLERWNFGRAHANRLLSAAQVSSELASQGRHFTRKIGKQAVAGSSRAVYPERFTCYELRTSNREQLLPNAYVLIHSDLF